MKLRTATFLSALACFSYAGFCDATAASPTTNTASASKPRASSGALFADDAKQQRCQSRCTELYTYCIKENPIHQNPQCLPNYQACLRDCY
jgi:hypothetical protein